VSIKNYGVSPIEKLLAPGFSQEMSAASAVPSTPFILYRAVVTVVINDVALRNDEEMNDLRERIGVGVFEAGADGGDVEEKDLDNKQNYLLTNAPRNTLLVRIINDGWDKKNRKQLLCYPFFPPHLCFPIKAGEQVWIITEVAGKIFQPAYWLCRIPEPLDIDGINFTHADRKFAPNRDPASLADTAAAIQGEASAEDEELYHAGFNNGGDGVPGAGPMTLFQPGSPKISEYEVIYTGSMANKSFTMEPVPRFTKRPGDLVLQGSNNTLISLGEDRGYNSEAPPPPLADAVKSNASSTDDEANKRSFAGTIDMVAGRGFFREPPDPAKPPEGTQPRTVKNTREKLETEKNPVLRLPEDPDVITAEEDRRYNPAEGDPDFISDASRVYVSMKTSGDANLGLEYPSFAGNAVDDKPYVVTKSDEIRIVGRQEGSVRIVKEGKAGEDQCVITMLADGTVAIDAKKIIIGDGRDAQTYLGDGATEPIFKGKELKAALDSLADFLNGPIGNMGSPLIGAAAVVPKFKSDVEAALSGVSFTK
jgi:hypothetical protein